VWSVIIPYQHLASGHLEEKAYQKTVLLLSILATELEVLRKRNVHLPRYFPSKVMTASPTIKIVDKINHFYFNSSDKILKSMDQGYGI
jgi:hypothetical protein